MARTKKQSSLRLIIGVVVILVAGFVIYNYLSVQANKKTFEQARSAVDNIYSRTTQSLGQPDADKHVNSCGNSQCTVYTSFVYGVADKSEAEKDFQSIQANIKRQSGFIQKNNLVAQIANTAPGYHSAQDVYNFKGLTCTAKYLFDTPQATLLKQKDESKKPFYVEVGCTGNAKQKYYNSAHS